MKSSKRMKSFQLSALSLQPNRIIPTPAPKLSPLRDVGIVRRVKNCHSLATRVDAKVPNSIHIFSTGPDHSQNGELCHTMLTHASDNGLAHIVQRSKLLSDPVGKFKFQFPWHFVGCKKTISSKEGTVQFFIVKHCAKLGRRFIRGNEGH